MAVNQRLDLWLDIACLFRTRAEAKRACEGGKVAVNNQRAKPNRAVRQGDRLRITRPYGRTQDVVVTSVTEHHVPKATARELYEDVTPPPPPEEIEARRLERICRAAAKATSAPDRRQRRAARRLKEGT
jgi:ribosome-associated heat shock protein Hsp15